MKRFSIRYLPVLALPLLMAAAPFHIELTDSFPEAEQTLDASPSEIWLQFSVEPNMDETSFSVRGPDGSVDLGGIVVDAEDAKVLRASVDTPMTSGEYTVSWVGAAPGDHAERGRFTFSVEAR